jgi:hypothetical protein
VPQIPNKIKYTSGITTSDTIKVKNFGIGMVDGGRYGPTSETNFWMGISPSTSGYTIYGNKEVLGPVIYGPQNDAELIEFAKKIVNPNITNVGQALLGFITGATDAICVNRDYESIVTSGLVMNLDAGYTPSYPRTGTTWYDLSYSGNNGTLINGPTYSNVSGGTLVFDGVDDYVNCAASSSLDLNSDLTINIWVYSTKIMNGVGVVTKGPLSSDYDYMLYITANSSLVTFYKKNSLGVAESMGFLSSLVNRWVNICFTKQGTAIRSYENATQKTTATFSTSDIRITSNSLKIGNGWSSAYGGNIPIVQIYNRALTATEVLKNYQEQFPRFLGENIVTNGLALYLDAGYGTSYPTTGTTWYDVSGYNNNATLVNGPSFNSGNGGSIVFDGTDDYGFTSATTSLGNSNTVCAFIKLNGLQTNSSGAGLSGGTIYTSTANGVDNYLGISGNKLYLFATEIADVNNFGLIGTTSLDTSNSVWYYVTSVINGNTATIYINGVLEATVTQSFIIASWSGNGFIGCRTTTTRLLKGSIANISVYSRALTQSEILQNFNAQKSRFGL